VSEPPFLTDHTAPYPLEYARQRMLEGVRVLPACSDDGTREALVRYVGHVATDCARHAEDAGLLIQADVYDLIAEALAAEPVDRPVSTDRAAVYHAMLDLDGDDALVRIGPLLSLLRRTA
jgi:hypothetical protein